MSPWADLPKNSDRCQCGACGELFNSTSMFDRHRAGQPGKGRRCLSPAEMEAKGYSRNAGGYWIRGQNPAYAGTARQGAEIAKNAPSAEAGRLQPDVPAPPEAA